MDKKPVDKLGQFFSKFKDRHYKRHEIIIRPDGEIPGVFYLSRGYIRLYALSESGQELSLIIFKPGDFFPMTWALNDVNVTQYLEAMTPVETYRCSKEEFKTFLHNNPEVLWEVTSKILIRLRGLLERMEYMVFGNAHQKVASILVICAERFGIQQKDEILIRVPLTHKEIANLIGLTRETTSVELKKLERAGIIAKKGGQYRIRDITKLENEAMWNRFE